MKFAWKVFFPCLGVMLLAFGILGYMLPYQAFQEALAQEKQRSLDRMAMLRTVLQTFTADFPYDGEAETLRETMEGVANGGFAGAQLFTPEGEALYPLGAPTPPLLADAAQGIAYDITKTGESYSLRCCGPVQLGAQVGYLYMEQDATAPFALYAAMAKKAAAITAVAALGAGAILLLLCSYLTRPLVKLAAITQHMAQGDYSQRAPCKNRDETGLLAASFNRMADALQAHMRLLEEEARKREDFVACFAHELKTPLTSIIGYGDMLRSQEADEATRFRWANYIFTEGRRLERLSWKLLQLLVLNRQAFYRYPMPTGTLADELEETAAAALQEKYGVSLAVDLEPACILIEPDLFHTLLINLVDNGGKASQIGQWVRVIGRREREAYAFQVQDQGRGIPQEDLQHVLEPFYMVDKSRARAQGGAGLGLALCQAIAGLHGARLEFKSELGQGTTVFFMVEYGQEAEDGEE